MSNYGRTVLKYSALDLSTVRWTQAQCTEYSTECTGLKHSVLYLKNSRTIPDLDESTSKFSETLLSPY